jgi:LPS sulfotransferase NodH
LCDLLTDTGVAGRPDSFFRRESFLEWANHFNVSVAEWRGEYEFDQSYLSAVRQYGSNGTEIFGMRLMWESVGDLSKRLDSLYPGLPSDSARFRLAFGSPLYVHLSREDKIAQAVSRLKAEQTGLWHISADGSERERLKQGQAPVYDARGLSMLVARSEEHDAAWTNWFAQQEVRPVRITYEALSTGPKAALATVLSALGLDSAIAGAAEPRTAIMADGNSREWAARFQTERVKLETPT